MAQKKNLFAADIQNLYIAFLWNYHYNTTAAQWEKSIKKVS